VSKSVHSVCLQPDYGFFIVSQMDGTVSILSINECSLISVLNTDNWNSSFYKTLHNNYTSVKQKKKESMMHLCPDE